ncbi:MAG: hypothetical protein HDR01_00515 [Lachnospiraceae bacterium]|nr:hypothetical protein [Lachnospiraceae bacterium]
MKKFKQCIILFIGSIALTTTIWLLKTIQLQKEYKELVDIKEGYIQVHDDYDSEHTNIYDFFEQENSLDILKNTYKRFVENESIDYYECMNQNFEYIGRFSGDGEAIDGGEELRNQSTETGQVTPLKSFQLSYDILIDLNLSSYLDEGNFFTEEDFIYDGERSIPVLLGSHYKQIMELNDEFEAYYLGSKIVKCKIIGFLQPDTTCLIKGEEYALNGYIISPAINIDSLQDTEDNLLFEKILYSEKCTGYIHYTSEEEMYHELRLLEQIATETNYQCKYYLGFDSDFLMYQFGLTEQIAFLLLFCAFLVWLAGVLIFLKESGKEAGCMHLDGKRLKVKIIKNGIFFFLIEILSVAFMLIASYNSIISYATYGLRNKMIVGIIAISVVITIIDYISIKMQTTGSSINSSNINYK